MKTLFIRKQEFNSFQTRLKQYEQKACGGIDLSFICNQREETFTDDNGILHIHIFGPLMADPCELEEELGATGYDDLEEELETANIKGVYLKVNSPGGEVQGLREVAEMVANLSVPSVAYVKGLACSAAYRIASGSDWVVSSPSSQVGNIGAILCYEDDSKLLGSLGITEECFVSEGATLKSIGHGELSDVQRSFLQESINNSGQEFKDFVSAHRPNINPLVWNAGWWSGEKAVELGLVDELGDEDLAYQRLVELVGLANAEPVDLTD